jgi:hypothetical protein
MIPQNNHGLAGDTSVLVESPLLVAIFFPLLAFDAVPCVRQGIQSLEGQIFAATMALAKILRLTI